METKENHKIIIFDFFGVICSEIAPFWFEKYFPAEKATELKHAYLRPADAGDISPETLFQNLADLVQTTPDKVEADWFSLVKIDKEVVSLIHLAKARYKIVLCSNALSPFIRRILRENDLEDFFDGIIISSEISVAKPDPAFFTKALSILNAAPEDIIFIDDNQKNTDAAQSLGIRSLVFTGLETLDFLKSESDPIASEKPRETR